MRSVAAFAPLLLLAGCGATVPAPSPPSEAVATVRLASDLAVAVPAGWTLATKLTALAGPAERFTLSSSGLPSGAQDNCGPRAAIAALPPGGVLAFVLEYRRRDGALGLSGAFPPRSAGLRLPAGRPQELECAGPGRILSFSSGKRRFRVVLAVGPRAPRARVARLLGVLRHMHVGAART